MRTCRLLPRAAVFLAGTALACALGAAEPAKDTAAVFGTMESAYKCRDVG